MNYENRKTKQHIKPKWFKNLITLAISFAMVVGIFGGMQMDVCAQGYTLDYNASFNDLIDATLTGKTFESSDSLCIMNNTTYENATQWIIRYKRDEHAEVYTERTTLNMGSTYNFSDLADIASQWKYDSWDNDQGRVRINVSPVSSSNPSPSASPSQSDSGATSSQTSSVPASTPHTRM